LNSDKIKLRDKVVHIMNKKVLGSYHVLTKWNKPITDIKSKWNRYTKKCIVKISSYGPVNNYYTTPVYRYLPELRYTLDDESTTWTEFPIKHQKN